MAKAKRYPLRIYLQEFGSEAQCLEYLAKQRWRGGYVRPVCGCHHAYRRYQCAQCRHQAPVTAGTVLHKTHMPLKKWFLAFYFFVCYDKRGTSAVQLAAMLGTTDKTAWYMLRRIRTAMGRRDAAHQLSGTVEFDDAYFGGPASWAKAGPRHRKSEGFRGAIPDRLGNPTFSQDAGDNGYPEGDSQRICPTGI